MNAELKRQLASLTPEEKEDAYYFLMADVVPDDDAETPPELIAELERRFAAHRADPSGSLTLEEFKNLFLPDPANSRKTASISSEMKTELDRRVRDDKMNPGNAMSLEDFKLRWAH